MNKHHLASAAWICFAAGAFALGWNLKPQQQSDSDSAGTGGTPVSSAAALPSRGPGRHHAPGSASAAADGPAKSRITGVAVPLSSESIAAIGREFRTATDPLVRRAAFEKLLAGLTAENALEVRKQIAHLDSNDPAFRDFHFAWGKIDGLAAVINGSKTDVLDMGPALAGWTTADPAAARAWYDSLEEKGNKGMNREQLKEAFVQGLAIADPAMAVDFVMGLGKAGDPRSKQMMSIVTDKLIQSGGPEVAAGWAAALPQGELRGHALSDVARAMVREDPAAAAVWARGMASDNDGGSIVSSISVEWGRRDGAATVQWLDSLSGDQSASYGPAVAGWARSDPLAASQHVAAMPPSGSRNNAIGGLVYSYRWEDPVAAVTWANEISDPKKRQDALTLAAEAYTRKDPAGAGAWLPSSGLPAETQQRLLSGRR